MHGWVRAATIAIILTANQTSAAEIEVIVGPEGATAFIHLQGEIVAGDAAAFHAAASDIDHAVVLLDSGGGSLSDGLEIGATISLRGFATAVLPPARCLSACALIWLAGRSRYMTTESEIGFHGAYDSVSGAVTGPGNAAIGVYLAELDLPLEAVLWMTTAPPDDLLYLDTTTAITLGIDVVISDPRRDSGFAEPETAVDWARYVAGVGYWRDVCSGYFGSMPPDLEELSYHAGNEAQAILPEDLWLRYQSRAVADLRDMIAQDGELVTCLFLEDLLRDAGADTEVGGPGFDCGLAKSPTERAICAGPQLWGEDVMMNALYQFLVGRSSGADAIRLRDGQRAWQTLRDGCGVNIGCLDGQYDARLQMMHAMTAQ